MKRTMIYLPDEAHQGLRKLAFEANTSVAELIRKAIEAVYGEDIEDIRDMEEELAKYRANPESAIDLTEYLRQKKAHVPG
jgi:predicted DNA-binding protein